MHIDGLTLMVAGGFIAAVGCVLLVAAWRQFQSAPAILWWAAAYFLNALAVAELTPGFAYGQEELVLIGAGLIPLGAAAIWAGTRALGYRRVPSSTFPAVATVWLASALLPSRTGPQEALLLATMALSALLFAAAGFELWRGRAERLPSRWPLTAVITVHTLICAFGVVDVGFGRVTADTIPSLTVGFGLIYFELILFQLASSVFVVMMCRERAMAAFVAAARVDALTGVANRGAFFAEAERLHRQAGQTGGAISAIIFDLDHFKVINDGHGHAVGDQVLRTFAGTANAVLRPVDFFGRIGGEEFAAILPGAGSEAASVLAERVRQTFAAVPMLDPSRPVQATVSAGVATAWPDTGLEAMLEAADRALYRAKKAGRNRVARAPDPPSALPSNVIRVADRTRRRG